MEKLIDIINKSARNTYYCIYDKYGYPITSSDNIKKDLHIEKIQDWIDISDSIGEFIRKVMKDNSKQTYRNVFKVQDAYGKIKCMEFILQKDENNCLIMLVNDITHNDIKNYKDIENEIKYQISCGNKCILLVESKDDVLNTEHLKISHNRFIVFGKTVQELKEKFNKMAMHNRLSGSVCEYPKDGSSVYQILRNLEYILEIASKEQSLIIFSDEVIQQLLKNKEVLDDLIASVEDNFKYFELNYQPLINGETGKLYGCESLLRWKHPKYSNMTPAIFVPLLEESGYIIEVGRWIIDTAFKQCKEWQNYKDDFRININTSYIQFKDLSFCDYILDALERYNLNPKSVIIELTESCKIEDMVNLQKEFKIFQSKGIQIALDDFGTGYHNLSILQDIKADWIKISPSFVSKIEQNGTEIENHIVEGIINLCKDANIMVCVEGIRDKDVYTKIRTYEPTLMQGFYFSRPINAEEFCNTYLKKD